MSLANPNETEEQRIERERAESQAVLDAPRREPARLPFKIPEPGIPVEHLRKAYMIGQQSFDPAAENDPLAVSINTFCALCDEANVYLSTTSTPRNGGVGYFSYLNKQRDAVLEVLKVAFSAGWHNMKDGEALARALAHEDNRAALAISLRMTARHSAFWNGADYNEEGA